MKMTHRHGNQNKRRIERQWIMLTSLVAISAFSLLFTPVRGALTQVLYKVSPLVWNIGSFGENTWSSFSVNFKEKKSLFVENEMLHADINLMQAQVLDRNLLSEKVIKLEEALGRTQSDNRVVAYVLAGPGLSAYDTLVVDVGEDNGVTAGNMVVYASAGVIGEVVEVSKNSSKVKLYSSSNEEQLVIVGKNQISTKATGKGMGNFEAKVPQGSAISLGDNVTLLKSGLLLGTVSFLEEKPSLPFARVLFRFPFNITEIHSVEVIINDIKRDKQGKSATSVYEPSN